MGKNDDILDMLKRMDKRVDGIEYLMDIESAKLDALVDHLGLRAHHFSTPPRLRTKHEFKFQKLER